jgi:hypothetical protein
MKQNNIEYINEILDNALPAFNNKTVSINANNGILNDNFLERQKSLFLKETLQYHRDNIIKVKQGYPIEDISDVTLTSEFFILPRKEYLHLKELINE